MFLAEPHRTTRNYAALSSKVGKEIFVKGHRKEPYYTAALALYKLEYFFRNGRLEPKYKAARFHILLAARLLGNTEPMPKVNSREMEKYCRVLMETLWDANKADDLIGRAARIADLAAGENFHRDNIRTEPFTKKVIENCKAQLWQRMAISERE